MEAYFKRIRKGDSSFSTRKPIANESMENHSRVEIELNLEEIVSDPKLRKPIEDFDIVIRDQARRAYLTKGPCQLWGHNYPQTKYGKQERSFQDVWYKTFPWLEYSISEDAVFCFWCYLFKQSDKGGRYAEDAFTKTGFKNWKKALEKFKSHVGAPNSCHNNARIQFESFQDQRHNVANMFRENSREMDAAYRVRLTTMLNATRFLLRQGLSFRGHDESTSSLNRGNFLELVEYTRQLSDETSKVLGPNAPRNNQMTSPKVQKGLAHACASEVTLAIVNDIGDRVFTLLVDEARDVSMKEQMGVVLRYVNKEGCVIERFLALVHVADTSSRSLKNAIDALFAQHGLSLSKLRGQGYDGASNMRGEFNGLKSLILQENQYAMYVHCFSHQLQLIIIVVAKGNFIVEEFFNYVSMIVNITGASCKRRYELRQNEHNRLVRELKDGERDSGRGKNQETSLVKPGDTRWGSHYLTLVRLCSLWPSIEHVLQNIRDDATLVESRRTAWGLIGKMDNYEFVFVLHLMKYLLGITHELSLALQQKDQNIVQAILLIDNVKCQLQSFREDGWGIIFEQVNSFCESHNISLIDMDDNITRRGYKRHGAEVITYLHYYRVRFFIRY